jgi:hypothetical protein
VVLFGHNRRQSTRFERNEIERLDLARLSMEEVQEEPERAAGQALQHVARHNHYAIHLDVDVVDFTDAPLSEHPSRNAGIKLDMMLRALSVLASAKGLVASRSPSSTHTTPQQTTDSSNARNSPERHNAQTDTGASAKSPVDRLWRQSSRVPGQRRGSRGSNERGPATDPEKPQVC